MQTHAIVELEEGALNVIVGGREGKTTRVVRSLRMPLADLGRETLTNTLRSIGSDVLQGAPGVHVVLGERRMQHFASTVPPMSASDVTRFVVREALRLTNQQSPEEVLLTASLLRRGPDGKLVVGATALARSVFAPLREAFAANSLEVLGLYSMETCLAFGARSAGNGPVALIECNAGRARFVLCDGDSPVQVRRFLIGGGGEANSAAMTTQLAMELPRTFEWLRETNQPLPKTLLLGSRVTLDDSSLEMLQGEELQSVRRAPNVVQVAEDLPVPSFGTALLLERLASKQAVASLLQPPRLVLPMRSSRVVGLAACLAAWTLREELAGVAVERDTLAAQLVPASVVPVAAPEVDERLQAALVMRRPISRLLADVSNGAGSDLHIEDCRFASTERIVVSGVVQGESRQQALAAIATFARHLQDIPYVKIGGDEEIAEVPRLKNCFRFKLGMTWRNP
jgi:hypothetical protein